MILILILMIQRLTSNAYQWIDVLLYLTEFYISTLNPLLEQIKCAFY